MKKNDGKERILSEAEKRRLEGFEKTSDEMIRQGYVRRNLTIDMGKASKFSLLLLIPLFAIGFGLYYLVNRRVDFSGLHPLILIVLLAALAVVHELIHGACWSIFSPHHFKDVEFGVMRPSLTPYCACLVPLKKGPYLFGSVMPLVILGILPMIAGIAVGNLDVLFIGIIMADAAAGDILIIRRIIGYKSGAAEVVYMDHPTEAGGVVFER